LKTLVKWDLVAEGIVATDRNVERAQEHLQCYNTVSCLFSLLEPCIYCGQTLKRRMCNVSCKGVRYAEEDTWLQCTVSTKFCVVRRVCDGAIYCGGHVIVGFRCSMCCHKGMCGDITGIRGNVVIAPGCSVKGWYGFV